MQHPTISQNTTPIYHELEEIDRLVHKLRERLSKTAPPAEPKIATGYTALRALRGMLKGKLTENPLTYQRRVRSESDVRLQSTY